MREDMIKLAQIIVDLWMGDRVDFDKFEEILKRNNIVIEDGSVYDMEE